jgi:transposase
MRRLRREVHQALEDGSRCLCAKTAATCFEILKVEEGLLTFARVPGIEPTNNTAERALRFAMIWRRRNVLEYLTTCFEAERRGQAIPSLLPVQQADINVA